MPDVPALLLRLCVALLIGQAWMLVGVAAMAVTYLCADHLLVDLEKRTAVHVIGWLMLWPLALLLAWMRGNRHG